MQTQRILRSQENSWPLHRLIFNDFIKKVDNSNQFHYF